MIKTWRWNKPVRWADICRSMYMCGTATNKNQVRKFLEQRMAAGEVEQIGRGLYKLAHNPD